MTPTHADTSRWLLRKPSDDAVARVFCFPYSGVGASMFNRWPRMIGDVEVCPIQLPGRENRMREPHYGTYERLAVDVADALIPHLDRPFVFFGHCAGSLPAFETAVLLARDGGPLPRQVFVSAQVAPHDCPRDRFLDMTEEQLRGELEQLVISQGGKIHALMIDLTLAVLREDLYANRVYKRHEPVQAPFGLSVVHWSDDPEVTEAELKGWEHYSDDVRFLVLNGGHYEFLSAPPSLLEHLAGAI
ncbi:alpha/beta fold hydrolase [Actinomadura sp. 6K520]|uniref:thioesterase II family protein n=1 Tax=Actinomadura sp. 6K520 TaxID=2530364 RepID=UPI0010468699|nr:alpha/beta fold hydrolase [Actinomadura sp. 6K520]TDE32831.1 thioesterase [Actinomadura sp. 6K520]